MELVIFVSGILLGIVIAMVGWIAASERRARLRTQDRATQFETLNALLRHVRVVRDGDAPLILPNGPIFAAQITTNQITADHIEPPSTEIVAAAIASADSREYSR